jgi:hypothetical protein
MNPSDLPSLFNEEVNCVQCDQCFACQCRTVMPKVGSFFVCQSCAWPMRVRYYNDGMISHNGVEQTFKLETIDMRVDRPSDLKEVWLATFKAYVRLCLNFYRLAVRGFLGQYKLARKLFLRDEHWELRDVNFGFVLSRLQHFMLRTKPLDNGLTRAWVHVDNCYGEISRSDVEQFGLPVVHQCCGPIAPDKIVRIPELPEPRTDVCDCHGSSSETPSS